MVDKPNDKKSKKTLNDDDIVSGSPETRRSFMGRTGIVAGLAAAAVIGSATSASASDPVGGGSDRDPNDPVGGGSDRDPNDPVGGGSDYD